MVHARSDVKRLAAHMRLVDACEILGIHASASRDDAQRAYRKQALLHHPDRSSAPDATSRFQTIGEAWERVQLFHDHPMRWGAHADPPEQAADAGPSTRHTSGPDHASWEELFKAWFGGVGGGTQWQEADFQPPPQHTASCQCARCAAERRRDELFARRAKEREARRRAYEQMMDDARQRSLDEAARTAERVRLDTAKKKQQADEQQRRSAARRTKAIAALEGLLATALDVHHATLEELLDAFTALKAAVEGCRKAGLADDEPAATMESGKTAATRESGRASLLARAERQLDVVGEAAARAAEADADAKAEAEAAAAAEDDEDDAIARRRASGGTRKQRREAARNASVKALMDLRAAKTAPELEDAITAAQTALETALERSILRKTLPEFEDHLCEARARLARLHELTEVTEASTEVTEASTEVTEASTEVTEPPRSPSVPSMPSKVTHQLPPPPHPPVKDSGTDPAVKGRELCASPSCTLSPMPSPPVDASTASELASEGFSYLDEISTLALTGTGAGATGAGASATTSGAMRSVRVTLGQRTLAIYSEVSETGAETLYAIDADCPHQGAALEAGDIEEVNGAACVVCPRHGWCFDLKTGWCDDLYDYGVRAFEVRRRIDGRIEVADRPNSQPVDLGDRI
jgi:nitrite reductase/ring-hydroxylating ferredoxin subunit